MQRKPELLLQTLEKRGRKKQMINFYLTVQFFGTVIFCIYLAKCGHWIAAIIVLIIMGGGINFKFRF